MIVYAVMPASTLVILCLNFRRLREEKMQKRFDSLYEGLNLDARSSLIFPVLFIVRRICFAAIACLLPTQIWLQILAQLAFVLIVAIYLISLQVFESDKQMRVEVFNEIT